MSDVHATIHQLIRGLRHKIGVSALVKIGEPSVEALIRAFADEKPLVRWQAEEALVQIGRPAVEALIRALADEQSRVRWRAARALGKIGILAVEVLVVALTDKNDPVRRQVADVLRQITREQPTYPLRGALPLLRRLSRSFGVSRDAKRLIVEVQTEIEQATAHLADVPLPAAAPAPHVSSLPRIVDRSEGAPARPEHP